MSRWQGGPTWTSSSSVAERRNDAISSRSDLFLVIEKTMPVWAVSGFVIQMLVLPLMFRSVPLFLMVHLSSRDISLMINLVRLIIAQLKVFSNSLVQPNSYVCVGLDTSCWIRLLTQKLPSSPTVTMSTTSLPVNYFILNACVARCPRLKEKERDRERLRMGIGNWVTHGHDWGQGRHSGSPWLSCWNWFWLLKRFLVRMYSDV